MEEGDIKTFLCMDVGGTNARAMISTVQDDKRKAILFEQVYKTKDYECIEDVIEDILSINKVKIDCCVLSLGGPKIANSIKITQCPHWPTVEGNSVQERFKFPKVYLLNDFEAAGYGVLNNQDFYEVLSKGEETGHSTKLIVGPGTGLGAAIIIYNETEKAFNVFAGEAGHQEFPAINEADLRLREFAFKYFEEVRGEKLDRLSVCQLTTGPSIPLLYEFYKTEYPELEVKVQVEEGQKEPDGFKIIDLALNHNDPLCLKVVEQILRIFAIWAGDLTVSVNCHGGVYITGGMGLVLKDYFLSHASEFLKYFEIRDALTFIMKKTPVYVLTREVGIDGAEKYGIQGLRCGY